MEGGPVALAIVGWREMTDQRAFDIGIQTFVETYGMPVVVISGGANGADTMGEKWAVSKGIPTRIFKPNWRNAEGVYDPGAGIKRNTDIVNACTHMLAFPSDKGKGTQDSIKKARKQNKIVVVLYAK